MTTQYAGIDSFPISFAVPDVGDAEGAAAVSVGLEALADRTQSLNLSRVALASFVYLRAINTTSLTNGTVRHVRGNGYYVFDSASVATPVDPWIIQPNTGPGRWIGGVPNTSARSVLVPGDTCKGVSATFDTTGTRSLSVSFGVLAASNVSAFPLGGAKVNDVTTGTSGAKALIYPISSKMIDGATFLSVEVTFQGAAAHAALPVLMPAIGIRRCDNLGTVSALYSVSSGFQSDPSPDLTTYQAMHTWTWVTNQNAVIDLSTYTYDLIAYYEGGTNALVNGIWQAFKLDFSGKIPARSLAT